MTRTPEQVQQDYKTYRGRCFELATKAAAQDPTLTLVRGYYFCPLWCTEEQHWWCVDAQGRVVDPSRLQFPSAGLGIYTPFDGTVECANCGKIVQEAEASIDGRYAFCSHLCHGQFVGVY